MLPRDASLGQARYSRVMIEEELAAQTNATGLVPLMPARFSFALNAGRVEVSLTTGHVVGQQIGNGYGVGRRLGDGRHADTCAVSLHSSAALTKNVGDKKGNVLPDQRHR